MEKSLRESPAKTELYERIVRTASEAFAKEGIKAVKMDDIASRLSISKRTLYETFEDKESLLFECMRRHLEETQRFVNQVTQRTDNVLEVILEFYLRHLEDLRQINYAFVEDLKKYPRVMEYLHQTRLENQRESILFFEKGVEQGIFKPEVNMKLVIELVQMLNEEIFRKDLGRVYPLEQLFKSVVLIFIRGISTDKGLRLLETLMENHDKSIQNKTIL